MSPFLRWSAVVLAGLLAAEAARADNYTWANPEGGNWNLGTNWSGGVVPAAADNVTLGLGGTYAVTLNDARSINNVALTTAGTTVNAINGSLNLGGTMTLTAGDWRMGGFSTLSTVTGGTITRGTGGTGTFTVDGTVRMMNTVVDGSLMRFERINGSRLQMAGTARFTPGSVVTFGNQLYSTDGSGVFFESGGTLNDLTINLGPNTSLGSWGGHTLTFGPNTLVQYHDPRFEHQGVLGRDVYDGGAGGLVTIVNQGTVRSTGGELYIGRYFTFPDSPSGVDLINSGLIEAPALVTMHLNQFTNAPGGVLRVKDGGYAFLFGRFGWVNNGTIEVRGDGSSLLLGGLFSRDGLGTVLRSGANTIGLFAARMENSGGTFALTADTGSYQLLGAHVSYGEIVGGAITATGGAKLEIRPALGFGDIADMAVLTGVAVGPGVLDFSGNRGRLMVRGGTTLTPGDTIALAGNDTALSYFQTQQVDGVAFVLSGLRSQLAVYDNNTLTLGPTTTLRKTGTGESSLTGGYYFATSGPAPELVNRGLVHVQQGMLRVGSPSSFIFTNRGGVRVDAGATWQGPLATDGGVVTGGGTVDGNLTFTGTGNFLRPGLGPGTLTVTGNLTLNAGTTFQVHLHGTAPGTGHDRLAVNGTVTLAGATLAAALGGGYVPAFEDRLFIVTNEGVDAVDGRFAGLADGDVVNVGGYLATISYAGDSASGDVFNGNDIVLYNFVPVPEPAAGLLVVAGLAAAVRGCRRRG